MAAGQIRAPIIIPLKPPQQSKFKNLTTEVKIDLVSETADIDIYFTVNGSKPEPFKTGSDKSTFKFTVPFCLPAGKRVVKAMAISRDGNRESNIVTKVFEIEKIDNVNISEKKIQQDTYGFLEELKDHKKPFVDAFHQEHKKNGSENHLFSEYNNSSGIQNSNIRSIVPQYLAARALTNKKSDKISDYLTGLNLEGNFDMNETMEKNKIKSATDHRQSLKMIPDYAHQSLRLQRETDFLKCVYCLAPRPTDPLTKFCNNCGQAIPPLPQSRLPPPENGELGICIHCRSTVPMNVFNCLVCEAPLNLQNQPQATNKLSERTLCSVCGTANPPRMDSCLTCEAKLPENEKAIKIFQSSQSSASAVIAKYPLSDVSVVNCVKCGRQNNIDARYCDWCGNKSNNVTNMPNLNTDFATCSKCGANNQYNAVYCGQCGNTINHVHRPNMNMTNGNGYSITLPLSVNNGVLKPEHVTSQNLSLLMHKNSLCDVSTQTVGLFYPSTAQLKKNEDKEKTGVTSNAWDKNSSLNVISPGKGYWRKQIDHIICHLKAHASNSPEFQSMIGEPRMGKLVSADVHEEDMEINLNLIFALKGYKDPYPRETLEAFDKRYLSSMLKRTGSFDSFRSDDTLQSNDVTKPKKTPTTSSRCRNARKKSLNKKSSHSLTEVVKSDANSLLLKEIGKSGEGRHEEIERLFDEGANPKGKNDKGIPFLIVAVRNKHKEAINMLCKLGANVNETEPESGNTPLHEAVVLGSMHVDIIDELLNCDANVKNKNNKGETPVDLAVKLHNEIAIKQFSSKIGKNQIVKLIQPKHFDESDDEKI